MYCPIFVSGPHLNPKICFYVVKEQFALLKTLQGLTLPFCWRWIIISFEFAGDFVWESSFFPSILKYKTFVFKVKFQIEFEKLNSKLVFHLVDCKF
jgi:hypothetical protein